jgi:YidC/Oxa1 family membrane protein insertase
MRKNAFLFYFAVAGLALAVPLLMPSSPSPQPSAAPAQAHAERAPADEPSAARAEPAPPAASTAREQLASIETTDFVAQVSSLNGGLSSFKLKDPQFRQGDQPIDVVTTDKPAYYPLHTQIQGAALGQDPPWQIEQLSPRAVRLHVRADSLAIERKLEAGEGPYQMWVTTTLVNQGDKPRKLRLIESTHHYVRRDQESGGVPLLPAQSSALSHGLCHFAETLERHDRSALLEPQEYKGKVDFSGIESVYFLKAIVSPDQSAESCRLSSSDRGRDESGDAIGSLFEARLVQPEIVLAPGEKKTQRVLAYFGPKLPEELAAAGHSLDEAINTGFFSSLANGLTTLLSMIHGVVGNWGIAIILLTVLVKLVLYPLTHKQMESMARMKELKPEMDRINELYANDREKKGAAIMEMYRKKGVNPMAGCFPVLLQLPIWFSLYASLSSNIRLLHAPFALWWRDLSSPDPYFVLPLALGVLMFVQQKMTPPAGADPLQAKMMLYVMPTMITSFMLFLPAGLCLYMFTNSALSIVQQRVIETRLARTTAKSTVTATAPASSDSVLVARDDAHAAPAGSKDKTAQRRLRRGRK